MRRDKILCFVIIALFLTFFFGIFSLNVYSQQEEVKKEFDEKILIYQENLNKYKDAYQDFLLKKGLYERYGSLQSKNEAKDAGVLLIDAMDSLFISYIDLVRYEISQGGEFMKQKSSLLNPLLLQGENFFMEQKKRIDSAQTLEDIEKEANLAKDEMKTIYPLFYEILAYTAYDKQSIIYQKTEGLFEDVKAKLDKIGASEDAEKKISLEKIILLGRWIDDAGNRLERAKGKQEEALTLFEKFPKDTRSASQRYESIISKLEESTAYLRETNLLLKEILAKVKVED